ncbi:MAG: 4-hydroxy-tetrahydrodipicolinate reductase [Clostridiales bacterium]|nr:4-hydroxy-tetrahydrodipicolinate reductase [Clostridiales bacterium]
MINILLSGCDGRMGQAVVARLKDHPYIAVAAGVDMVPSVQRDYPVYKDFSAVREKADVAVDFSHISLTPALLDYCKGQRLPLVLCTTGVAGELEAQVAEAAKEIPIFKSANMSLGVSLLQALVRQAAGVLGDTYDIEIIEKHHNTKVDAPSGTALMIAEAAASALAYKPRYVYDRTGEHRKRDPQEIGIHAVRGGAIVGEHEVMFIGPHEILSISHSAQSRELFATGAVKAAEYLAGQSEPRFYTMDDLVRSLA